MMNYLGFSLRDSESMALSKSVLFLIFVVFVNPFQWIFSGELQFLSINPLGDKGTHPRFIRDFSKLGKSSKTQKNQMFALSTISEG